METDKIAQAFESAGISTSISCDEAFSLAARFGITKKEIRDYCDANRIKIRGSQASCFR
jgi:hypothetical protein